MSIPTEPGYYWARHVDSNDRNDWQPVELDWDGGGTVPIMFQISKEDYTDPERYEFGPKLEAPNPDKPIVVPLLSQLSRQAAALVSTACDDLADEFVTKLPGQLEKALALRTISNEIRKQLEER